MISPNQPPAIFSERRKHALQSRAYDRGGASFVWDYLAEEVSERLIDVSRDFADVLVIGPLAQYGKSLLGARNANLTYADITDQHAKLSPFVLITENRLPFDPDSFDLVICAGALDRVNDLPGALIQIRRCLRPDGLFLGSLFGEGNLSKLRSAMISVEQHRASAHIHPQIDLKSAADLLSRAGFALPVADTDMLRVRYSSLLRLLGDIRDMGTGNALTGKRPYFGQAAYRQLLETWNALGEDDGRVEEQFGFIHLSGWAPSEHQPKPARRGSATVSLTSVLKPS